MIIRPLTYRDVIDMWGRRWPEAIKGIAIEDQGELLAIAGLRYSSPIMCFSDTRPGLKRSPKTIMKAAKRVVEMIEKSHLPVYAVASEQEPRSMQFLAHLGFTNIGGRNYKWLKPQQ